MKNIDIYVPGHTVPFTIDEYADYLATVAACGTYEQACCLPDEIYYDNPREETFLSITPTETEMTRSN